MDPLVQRAEAFFQRYQAAVDRRIALLLAPSTHRADVLQAVSESLALRPEPAQWDMPDERLVSWMDTFNENADVFLVLCPFLEDAIELAQRYAFDVVLVQADFPPPHRRRPQETSALQGLLLPLIARASRPEQTLVRVIGAPQSLASSFDARLVGAALEDVSVTDVGDSPRQAWQRVLDECLQQRATAILERQVGLVEAEALAEQLQSAALQARELAEQVERTDVAPGASALAALVALVEAAEVRMLGSHWTLATLFPVQAKRLDGADGVVPGLRRCEEHGGTTGAPRGVVSLLQRLHETCMNVARRLRSVNRDRYVAKLFVWEPFVKLSHPGGEFGELRVPNYLVNVEALRRQVRAYGDLLTQCRTRLGAWRPFLPTVCFQKVREFVSACGGRLASLGQAAAAADLPTCRQAVTSLSALSEQLKQAHRLDLYKQCAVTLGAQRVVTRPAVRDSGSTALFEIYGVAEEVADGLQHMFDPHAFPIEAVELTKLPSGIELKVVQRGTLESLREVFHRGTVRAGAGLQAALDKLAGHCELAISAFTDQREFRYYPFRDELQEHACAPCEARTEFVLRFPQPDPRNDLV